MRLSVLDLSPIIEGGDASLAFRNTVDLAQHAEKWGYHRSAVGSPETVRRRLQELLKQTQADEIIATGQIYDHTARLRSFEIAAEQFRAI